MKQKIIVATGNKGKLREIERICKKEGLVFTSLADEWENLPEIPETGSSFYENAKQKAMWVHTRKGCAVMADDSGLEVDALDNAPGIYSARYSGKDATDEKNIEKLLDELKDTPFDRRGARFRCVIVYITQQGEKKTAEGICEGRISLKPEGKEGFGYDPVFIPDGYDKTFAQLGPEIKNRISHRAKALENVRGFFFQAETQNKKSLQ